MGIKLILPSLVCLLFLLYLCMPSLYLRQAWEGRSWKKTQSVGKEGLSWQQTQQKRKQRVKEVCMKYPELASQLIGDLRLRYSDEYNLLFCLNSTVEE